MCITFWNERYSIYPKMHISPIPTANVLALTPSPAMPVAHDLTNKAARSDAPSYDLAPFTSSRTPIMHPKRTFKVNCSDCGREFAGKYSLMRHCKSVCGNIRNPDGPWKCKHCNNGYESRESLTRHEKFSCRVPPKFTCFLCNKEFRHKTSMLRHMYKKHDEQMQGANLQTKKNTGKKRKAPPAWNQQIPESTSKYSRSSSLSNVSEQRAITYENDNNDGNKKTFISTTSIKLSIQKKEISYDDKSAYLTGKKPFS